MRITFQPVRPTRSGFALVIVLAFLMASLVVFASVMYWATSDAKNTQRNNAFNQSEAAAESASEFVISKMMSDFNNLCLNATNSYNTLIPPTNGWPILYQFSATNSAPGLSVFVSIGPTNWSAIPSQFTGLNGLGQNCIIACTATPLGQPANIPATVAETVWFGTIPVFQYAVFYNVVLEINPGAAFTINGRVHCNTNIFCTGSGTGTGQLLFLNPWISPGLIPTTPVRLIPRIMASAPAMCLCLRQPEVQRRHIKPAPRQLRLPTIPSPPSKACSNCRRNLCLGNCGGLYDQRPGLFCQPGRPRHHQRFRHRHQHHGFIPKPKQQRQLFDHDLKGHDGNIVTTTK